MKCLNFISSTVQMGWEDDEEQTSLHKIRGVELGYEIRGVGLGYEIRGVGLGCEIRGVRLSCDTFVIWQSRNAEVLVIALPTN